MSGKDANTLNQTIAHTVPPASSGVQQKPPTSDPQKGDKLNEWFMPTAICPSSVFHDDSVSPDHTPLIPHLAIPK